MHRLYKNIESPKTDSSPSVPSGTQPTPSAAQVIAQKLWEAVQK